MREYEVWMIDRETEDPTGILMISACNEAEAERKAEELRPGETVAACEWTGASDGEEDEITGKANLIPGAKYWCGWMHRYLWYKGRAYNGKDYEFTDAGDILVTLNEAEIGKLERR